MQRNHLISSIIDKGDFSVVSQLLIRVIFTWLENLQALLVYAK